MKTDILWARKGTESGKSTQICSLAGQEFSRRNQLADIRSKKVASR